MVGTNVAAGRATEAAKDVQSEAILVEDSSCFGVVFYTTQNKRSVVGTRVEVVGAADADDDDFIVMMMMRRVDDDG